MAIMSLCMMLLPVHLPSFGGACCLAHLGERCARPGSGRLACRWVNCLLIREIPFTLAIRLWDTYLAEGARMRDFLTYVLAAFLLTWSAQLRSMDFQARDWGPL